MQTIQTPWKTISLFLAFMGTIFLIIDMIFYFTLKNNVFFIHISLLFVISSAFFIKHIYDKNKLENLKNDGISYDCTVVEIIPLNMVKIFNYVTARVICEYKVGDKKYSKSSGFHLFSYFDRIENLGAKIYIDKFNDNKYIITVYRTKNILKL